MMLKWSSLEEEEKAIDDDDENSEILSLTHTDTVSKSVSVMSHRQNRGSCGGKETQVPRV